jgi:F-type H+-transporting ATPase subunit delta
MGSNVYAKRYAQALFRMAQEAGEINAWQSDLRTVARMCRDEALSALLERRDVAFEEKSKVLSERLGSINPVVLKLVSMLVAKGRLDMMGDIWDEYQLLVDSFRGVEGVELAEVTTAIPLGDEDKLKLARRITDMLGKPVVLKTSVDPGVIGGVIIRVGDRLIDGSIRSKLAALRRELGAVGG